MCLFTLIFLFCLSESFAVRDTGDVNLAYTNLSISMHTDLPQFLNPPDVRVLFKTLFVWCVS